MSAANLLANIVAKQTFCTVFLFRTIRYIFYHVLLKGNMLVEGESQISWGSGRMISLHKVVEHFSKVTRWCGLLFFDMRMPENTPSNSFHKDTKK